MQSTDSELKKINISFFLLRLALKHAEDISLKFRYL